MGSSSSLASITSDWLIANGGTLQKALYPELFNVIGYAYGGSGVNFKLPYLTDGKHIRMGSGPGGVVYPTLPNISGCFRTEALICGATGGEWWGGAFYPASTGSWHIASAVERGDVTGYYFSATRSNGIYQDGCNDVIPYAMYAIPIIKVK